MTSSCPIIPRCLVLLCVFVLVGCGADIDEENPDSITQIKQRLRDVLDEIEAEIESGRVHPARARRLAGSVRFLRGRLDYTKVGSPENIADLDEIGADLSDLQRFARERGPAAAAAEQQASLRQIVPRLRKILDTLPDSDK